MVVNCLKEALDEFSLKASGDKERILEGLARFLRCKPEYDREVLEWTCAITSSVTAWYKLRLTEKLSPLSKELQDLRVNLTVPEYQGWDSFGVGRSRTWRDVRFSIPMFAVVDFDEENWRLKTSGKGKEENSGYESDLSIELSAKAPLIPREVHDALLEAKAITYDVTSEGLRIPAIREAFIDSLTGRLKHVFSAPDPSKYKVIWRPHPAELKLNITSPRDKDPALILDYQGQWYVVKTWDSESELPFKHILKEYSADSEGIFRHAKGV
jgi:hypothetical protein